VPLGTYREEGGMSRGYDGPMSVETALRERFNAAVEIFEDFHEPEDYHRAFGWAVEELRRRYANDADAMEVLRAVEERGSWDKKRVPPYLRARQKRKGAK